MKKIWRLTLAVLIVQLVIASSVAAQDQLSEDEVLRIVYSDFLTIESFGNIRVVFEGEDAEKIRLNSSELTDFLKLKFKNNFVKPFTMELESVILHIHDNKCRILTIHSIIRFFHHKRSETRCSLSVSNLNTHEL